MSKSVCAVIFSLCVCLAVAIIWAVSINNELSKTKADLALATSELSLTKTQLNDTRADLSSTQADLLIKQISLNDVKEELATTQTSLTSTKKELETTQISLNSTNAELTATKYSLTNANAEITSTKTELSNVKSYSSNLQTQLANSQQQLRNSQETLWGLGITLYSSSQCRDVALVDNPNAVNPTYQQLLAFLSQDQTEQHNYIKGVYDCSQYSRDLHNRAEEQGIRAAEVQIDFSNVLFSGHALNAFLTTDRGLVYIDCTEHPDSIARIKKGKDFKALEINKVPLSDIRNDAWWDSLQYGYYYIKSSFPTITRYSVVYDNAKTSGITIYW